MVDRGSDLSNEYDSDSESSASWESARSELDSDSLSGDETDLKVPKIQLLIGQIADQVTSLYDLSALLRRPMVTNRYISSTSPRKGKDVMSDVIPLSISFTHADEQHVIEKILQWRALNKSGLKLEFPNEVPKGYRIETDNTVEDIAWFCQRLARGNTRRREQLQYWSDNPCGGSKISKDVAKATIVELPQTAACQGAKTNVPKSINSQISTIKQPGLGPDHDGTRRIPMSEPSRQGFSAAALSVIQDDRTHTRALTVYSRTTTSQRESNFLQGPPSTAIGSVNFPCPYCGAVLQSDYMKQGQNWRCVHRISFIILCSTLTLRVLGDMYSAISALTCAPSKIVRMRKSCMSVAMNGYITNFKSTGETTSATSARTHLQVEHQCLNISKDILKSHQCLLR